MVIDFLIPSLWDSARDFAVIIGSADPDEFARSLCLLFDFFFGIGFLSACFVYLLWSLGCDLCYSVVKRGDQLL
jgi:hypothetical protein